MTVFVRRSDGRLDYTFDWADDVPEPLTLESVTMIIDEEIVLVSETTNSTTLTSTFVVTGGIPGKTYLHKALAALSNGVLVPGEATERIFDA